MSPTPAVHKPAIALSREDLPDRKEVLGISAKRVNEKRRKLTASTVSNNEKIFAFVHGQIQTTYQLAFAVGSDETKLPCREQHLVMVSDKVQLDFRSSARQQG